jgi:predicted dehydrogenase
MMFIKFHGDVKEKTVENGYPIIRVGIIGTGQIGKYHLENYTKNVEGVEVVAVCDIREDEAQRVAEKYQIPKVYVKFRELLEREDIQAVDVCLHNNLHRPVTELALAAGKHVYCEKPMAGSYIDALAMYQTAQRLGLKLSIQLSTLFAKETRAAMELINAGNLGRIYHARSMGFRRRGRPFVDGYGSENFVKKEVAGGGALYDMGVYHIASMLYLLGNPQVLTISGKTYQETPVDPKRFELSHYNVEELGVGFVRMSKNISLDIIESWAIHLDKFEGSIIVGSNGGIRLEPFGFFWNENDLAMSASGDLGDFGWRKSSIRQHEEAYKSPQNHWIASLQGKVPLLPTAELALNTMLISEGIYLSERLGREVTADEVRQLSVSSAVEV